jgi:hypothetical protein
MVWAKYETQREMLEHFTRNNTCEGCFISTRANTEKTFGDLLADNWGMLVWQAFSRKPKLVKQPEEAPAEAPAEEPVPENEPVPAQ